MSSLNQAKDLIIRSAQKTALIIGATGLIGQACVKQLLQSTAYSKIKVVVRRKTFHYNEKLEEIIIPDFDTLSDYGHDLAADDVFCCLGTTMKIAGSKEAFYRVDYTYIVTIAKIAAMNNAKQFLLISSVGADPHSLFYYSKVKGETERTIKKLPFWAIRIIRPSVLKGDREENRLGERVAIQLGSLAHNLMGSILDKYAPIDSDKVARYMVHLAQSLDGGTHTYESDAIQIAKI